ncbi:DNA damage-regulated autophagy modulator protein 2 [Paragonimus heterotremus]|uniref:DNA damage-regulated autophagy modulator protein 2 n=1 Tax=Paragonimus heterotremus TaxID=100268 RepID=A0A8J4TEI6_9TREM|nr:DNA damage-regulated autophagy modulator protein 2 [Paragonimus heterotremus]
MVSQKTGLHFIPILICILMTLAFVISYTLAVSHDHISVAFPYISDTGTWVPESCVFGQLLNLIATLSGFCAYVWHKQALARLPFGSRIRLRRCTHLALVSGLISAFGTSLVANFQETAVWSIHLTGAALLYGCGLVYMALVTRISYHYGSSKLCILRILLCLLSTLSAILIPSTGTVARFMYDGTNIRKWKPTDQGYAYHAVSSFSEWFLAFCFLSFFCTMVTELKDYTVRAVKVEHRWIKLNEVHVAI